MITAVVTAVIAITSVTVTVVIIVKRQTVSVVK